MSDTSDNEQEKLITELEAGALHIKSIMYGAEFERLCKILPDDYTFTPAHFVTLLAIAMKNIITEANERAKSH